MGTPYGCWLEPSKEVTLMGSEPQGGVPRGLSSFHGLGALFSELVWI